LAQMFRAGQLCPEAYAQTMSQGGSGDAVFARLLALAKLDFLATSL
jgi:hypothetical protein